MAIFRNYYSLIKPGIVRGNAITATAGFFLASGQDVKLGLLAATLSGLSLVVASATVSNNYIDRSIDIKMKRTRDRTLVSGKISPRNAVMYALVLGVAGFLILATFTTAIAVLAAFAGFILYIFLYSMWFKRHSVYGTEAGSLSGAMPPVVGYTAVSGQIDTAAVILFLILVSWQMPHFYSIAIYRMKDYTSAKIPVLPLVKGVATTRNYILVYIILFTAGAASLTAMGYTGKIYAVIAIGLGLAWLAVGLKTYNKTKDEKWGRIMFLFSLVVITVVCAAIIADSAAGLK